MNGTASFSSEAGTDLEEWSFGRHSTLHGARQYGRSPPPKRKKERKQQLLPSQAHYYPSYDDDFEWPAPTYADIAATPRGVFLLPALARDVVRISAGPQVTYDLSIRGTGKCEVERPNVYGFRLCFF